MLNLLVYTRLEVLSLITDSLPVEYHAKTFSPYLRWILFAFVHWPLTAPRMKQTSLQQHLLAVTKRIHLKNIYAQLSFGGQLKISQFLVKNIMYSFIARASRLTCVT